MQLALIIIIILQKHTMMHKITELKINELMRQKRYSLEPRLQKESLVLRLSKVMTNNQHE